MKTLILAALIAFTSTAASANCYGSNCRYYNSDNYENERTIDHMRENMRRLEEQSQEQLRYHQYQQQQNGQW